MPEHTSGPWAMRSIDGSPPRYVIGPQNQFVAECDHDGGLIAPAEIEANARLIAAAPDLLAERDRLRALNAELVAVLTDLLAVVGVRIDDPRIVQFDDARAVLARATEGQS